MIKPSKISSATMMETMVSMVILLIVFGVAFHIYIQVMSSNYNRLKANALVNTRHHAQETKVLRKFIDEVYIKEGYEIEKSVEVIDNSSLVRLTFVAQTRTGKVLYEWKEVVNVSE